MARCRVCLSSAAIWIKQPFKSAWLYSTNQQTDVASLPREDLSQGFCNRDTKGDLTVQDGDADLNLGDRSVKGSCYQPQARQFHAMHLCLNAAPAVVSVPIAPKCPTQVFLRSQGIANAREGSRTGSVAQNGW